jgi:hypothetical protein
VKEIQINVMRCWYIDINSDNFAYYMSPCLYAAFTGTACPKSTDKKENLIVFIYKEIQNEAVAKSFMTNGLFIYG